MLPGPSPRPERRERWRAVGVDTLAVAGAVAFGLLIQRDVLYGEGAHPPLAVGDLLAGAASLASTWWLRRRAPVAYTSVGVAVSLVSSIAGAVPLIGVFSTATRRGPRVTVAVTALAALSTLPQLAIYPVPEDLRVGVGGPSIMVALAAGGQLRAARRRIVDLLAEQLEDARRADLERQERTRREERVRIAREMHDTLGHRLSLLAVHSGALAFRRDEVPEDAARAAEVVRVQARAALGELRSVVAVLRDPAAEAGPLPTPEDLPALVAEARDAGLAVTLDRSETVPTLPVALAHTIHRVVQEALTNSRRHGGGRAVRVRVGAGEDGLVVEIRDGGEAADVSAVDPDAGPGGGAGLVGLAERVSLAGGVLHHGPAPDGFVVRAVLPLPDPSP